MTPNLDKVFIHLELTRETMKYKHCRELSVASTKYFIQNILFGYFFFLTTYISLNYMMLTAFILLENISKDFRWPCAIDLKMGTRPVGDKRVSKDKYERHLQRVNSSTSGKLGVRLCGMQVRIFMPPPSTKLSTSCWRIICSKFVDYCLIIVGRVNLWVTTTLGR